MRRAARAGVASINDVSALTHDPGALQVGGRVGPARRPDARPGRSAHHAGRPALRRRRARRLRWAGARIEACEQAGIPRSRLIVDPGIGFGKTLAHNLELLGALSIFHGLGCAVLLGASRKSFIGRLTGAGAERSPARLARRGTARASRRACRSCASTMSPQLARRWRCGRGRRALDAHPLSSRGLSPGPSGPQARRLPVAHLGTARSQRKDGSRQQVPG